MGATKLQEVNSTQGAEAMQPGQHTQMVLASCSKFFLNGICSLIRDKVDDIKIVTLASSREIKEHLPAIKPDFLFFDNTTLRLNVQRLFNFINRKSPNTKVILFGNSEADTFSIPNVIFITAKTTSSRLIQLIKDSQ